MSIYNLRTYLHIMYSTLHVPTIFLDIAANNRFFLLTPTLCQYMGQYTDTGCICKGRQINETQSQSCEEHSTVEPIAIHITPRVLGKCKVGVPYYS